MGWFSNLFWWEANAETQQQLTAIQQQLTALLSTTANMENVMASFEELQQKMNDILANAASERAEVLAAIQRFMDLVNEQKAEIITLRNQIAAGVPVTQEQLDALFATASNATLQVADILTSGDLPADLPPETPPAPSEPATPGEPAVVTEPTPDPAPAATDTPATDAPAS